MPSTAVSSGSSFSSRREVAEVLAVGRRVLADEEQLAHALLPQPARLGDDVGGPARDEGAAEHRDGAERAAPVAPAGDLQGRPGPGVEPGAHELLAVAVARAAPRRPPRPERSTGDRGSSVRRSDGHVGCRPRAAEDGGAGGSTCRGRSRSRARRRHPAARRRASGRSARRGSPRRRPPWCARSALRSAASRRVSMESFLACSTKPQVLTTATSASAASSTRVQPSAASRPASSSESTSLRVHPRVTSATLPRLEGEGHAPL